MSLVVLRLVLPLLVGASLVSLLLVCSSLVGLFLLGASLVSPLLLGVRLVCSSLVRLFLLGASLVGPFLLGVGLVCPLLLGASLVCPFLLGVILFSLEFVLAVLGVGVVELVLVAEEPLVVLVGLCERVSPARCCFCNECKRGRKLTLALSFWSSRESLWASLRSLFTLSL